MYWAVVFRCPPLQHEDVVLDALRSLEKRMEAMEKRMEAMEEKIGTIEKSVSHLKKLNTMKC